MPVDPLSPSKRNLPKPRTSLPFPSPSFRTSRLPIDPSRHLCSESFPAPLLLNVTHILSLALLLKEHLKTLYNLPEAKCRKFSFAAKKTAMGDRPAVRQLQAPLALELDGVPGVLGGEGEVKTLKELEELKEVFLRLIEEGGDPEGARGEDDE